MAAPLILGVILAGGQSRRMGGGDKALLNLGHRTLLEWVTERIAPQCAAGLVLSANGRPARFTTFRGPILADTVPGYAGPLAGVLMSLDFAAELDPGITHVASVPSDTPLLPKDLVARLAAALAAGSTPIAHASSAGRGHYMSALWPVDLRRDLRAALLREDRGASAFIARHGATIVDWSTDPVDPFLNINTAEDLAIAAASIPADLR